ncbi:MAG: hypothetical protein RMK50_07070 [Nitrososphaerota archaeon]|nr:hypothetical protein [Candidatus Bathyarchaeota archaeon]MDW8194559.1 hypothetical protein [Nitrososphaerota archaeon]
MGKQRLNSSFSKEEMEKLRLTALINDTMAKIHRVLKAFDEPALDKAKCQLNLIMALQNLLKLSKKLKVEPKNQKKNKHCRIMDAALRTKRIHEK